MCQFAILRALWYSYKMALRAATSLVARQLRSRPAPHCTARHASTTASLPPGCSYHADFLTADEQDALIDAIKARLKGTGYERDHWDAVIDRYREREMLSVDDELAEAAVERVRAFLRREQGVTSFLPPHCIDLCISAFVLNRRVPRHRRDVHLTHCLIHAQASTWPRTGA